MTDEPRKLLESQRIEWNRDWDALVVGFILGALVSAVMGFTARAVMGW